jgi:hypothetical protein
MLIRSDYGHGKNLKHTNIDLYTRDGKKISDDNYSFIEQNFEIPFYEMALHYVFMQVEKHNILIGPQYWISPFKSHLGRINTVLKAWTESKVTTPLCIVSRNIQTAIAIISHDQNKEILDSEFAEILSEQLSICKSFEKGNPDSYYVNLPSDEN